MTQAVATERRTPSQRRSGVTVETILEAVAQILESGSDAGFTTNRVAEKAGYSIGTLYRYFPNKQALVQALVRRETDKQELRLRRLVESEADLPPDALLRSVLRCALRPFDDRRGLQRTMMNWLFSERDIVENAMAVGDRLMPLLTARLAAGQRGTDMNMPPIARRATLGAVIGAILVLARHEPAAMQSPEVEDELVRLLLHGLQER